jgi:protein involved in polysaccharide export with SLBB domain
MFGSHSPSTAAVANGSPTNAVMRVGDKITVRLSGVPDEGFFNEIQIPASGDITVPLLTQSFHAAGHNTAELASEISDAYKSQKIYTNPVVTVLPEERFINVGGDVRGPTNVVWRPDSTLMSTINSCGGFTEFANRRAVRIIRGQQVIEVDCVKAAQNPGADPPVYPGDQIHVPRTMF